MKNIIRLPGYYSAQTVCVELFELGKSGPGDIGLSCEIGGKGGFEAVCLGLPGLIGLLNGEIEGTKEE